MNENLANEIELVVLAFFQERSGFKGWWDSLGPATQAAMEVNLIDRITRHPLPEHVTASGSGRLCEIYDRHNSLAKDGYAICPGCDRPLR